MSAYDSIDLGIIWDRLISITDEIVSALIRTSFSTIVRESGDLSCVLFDADGNTLAQGTYSVPSFTGTAPITLRHMLKRFPIEELRPGDVSSGRRSLRQLQMRPLPRRDQVLGGHVAEQAGIAGTRLVFVVLRVRYT